MIFIGRSDTILRSRKPYSCNSTSRSDSILEFIPGISLWNQLKESTPEWRLLKIWSTHFFEIISIIAWMGQTGAMEK